MKPSPRLRRVLRIAHLTAALVTARRDYQTDVNAWWRYENSLPPRRHPQGRPVEEDDDACPF